MPDSDQPSLSSQVQQLTEKVITLETKVEQHAEFFDIQREIFAVIAAMKSKLLDLILDANLARRKSTDSPLSDEGE